MNPTIQVLLVTAFTVLAWSSVASSAIYKYRDANGGVVFTDHELTTQESQQRGLSLYDSQESSVQPSKSLPMPAPNSTFTSETDLAWLSSKLVEDYRGNIVKIEKLTPVTCWAILDSSLSVAEVMKTTSLICQYIRNASARKVEPNVHTFQGMTHMAKAKPTDCTPELKVEKW